MILPVNVQPFVPVNPQLDPVKPSRSIPPVGAPQPAPGETEIDLRNREREDAALRLREQEQRRQQQRNGHWQEALVVPGDELNADNTVPAVPLMNAPARQGLWVDLEV